MKIKLLPQSISGRLLLCSIVILCMVQVVSLLSFYLDSLDKNDRFIKRMATMRIAGVINTIDKLSPLNYQDYLVSQHHPGLFFFISERPIFQAQPKKINQSSPTSQAVSPLYSKALEQEIVTDIKAELANNKRELSLNFSLSDEQKIAATTGCLELRPLVKPNRLPKKCNRLTQALDKNIVAYAGTVDILDGRYLNFISFQGPHSPLHLGYFCVCMVLLLTLIGSAALYAIIKINVKPLNKLTKQTAILSQNYKSAPLKEEGAQEIQNLIRSFNSMQKKLADFISDRTRILAAISHDLKTPLTSMALRAEFLPDSEDKTKLIKNIETMTSMVKATLQFAKSDEQNKVASPLDLNKFLATICAEYNDNGAQVTFNASGTLTAAQNFLCVKMEMHRIIQNLVDNALTYGTEVKMELTGDEHETIIMISDNGPGIPEKQIEDVFAPFMRLDKARNTTDGHAGLGLAIVRNLVLKQGGTIKLKNITPHGLKATITYSR